MNTLQLIHDINYLKNKYDMEDCPVYIFTQDSEFIEEIINVVAAHVPEDKETYFTEDMIKNETSGATKDMKINAIVINIY